ncbi:uncharacterized protein CTRU02_202664 [Colletotrichum truncatum]|uniref:Uncharacterized protein n=1 Tax=Colletotrichum truncatum TaxID=5467 RepID=A0ACC3ZKV6_COLTU|nr:uncharacterized protein CTRU02_10589 [Colletotrichum truncatum]KAF6786890.1 hypothetical protein CTRU02_10589 [Colletotrichum truncatum]
MHFLILLTITIFSAFVLAADCGEAQVTGDAITGFRFSPGCNTWQWWSRDKQTTITLNPDCQLRQAWPNPQAVKSVCIRRKPGGDKCFNAPDAAASGGFCGIPPEWCSDIENMWGW